MDASTFHSMIATEFGISVQIDKEYLDQIAELVLQGVLINSLTSLSDQQAAELESLEDSGAEPAAVVQFLQSAIPNFQELVRQEILTVKGDIGVAQSEQGI